MNLGDKRQVKDKIVRERANGGRGVCLLSIELHTMLGLGIINSLFLRTFWPPGGYVSTSLRPPPPFLESHLHSTVGHTLII